MNVRTANRLSAGALVVLSPTALLPILAAVLRILVTGQTPAPERDEGTGAHIFQLSIAGLAPALLVYLSTADWTRPWRAVRTLAPVVLAVALAFALLYQYEHR